MARKLNAGSSLALIGSLGWACYGTPLWTSAQNAPRPVGAQQVESLFGDTSVGVSDGDDTDTPDGQTVKVSDLGEIDLHVKNIEITKVLQLLSLQSQRNIVASRNVAGSISADLYGVEFYEALDAILHTNGFGYREEGSFIYVYTTQELKEIAEIERTLEVKVIRLNYLTAADASTFVTPLLSDVGEIALSGEVPGQVQPGLSDAGRNSNALDEILVIRDYSENLNQIGSVLAELDRRPIQVQIEATVMEAKLTNLTGWGVDLSILSDWGLSNFEDPLGVVDSVLSGDVVGGAEGTTKFDVLGTGAGWQTTVGNTTAPAGFKFGVLSDHVAAFIRALDEVTDTTIIARPKLLVLNRQRAALLIGSKLGYVSTTQTETSATQTVEFLDVGTQLNIRPFVSADEFIRLEVSPKVSNGSVDQLGDFIVPNETTNELVTNVIVRNGQTVVLGGMFKEDTIVSRAQVPGLGDIPLIGAAMQGQDDTVRRSEVIFMITPTIVHDQYLTQVAGRAGDAIDAARLGTREEMLPFSREKLTAFHLRQARDHFDSGNTDRARWHLKIALTMDPTLQEARRMKEGIDGERIWWPDRSMLDYAIHGAVDQHIKSMPISAPFNGSAGPSQGQGSSATPSAKPVEILLDEALSTPGSQRPVSFQGQAPASSNPASRSESGLGSDFDAGFEWEDQGEFQPRPSTDWYDPFTPGANNPSSTNPTPGVDSARQVDSWRNPAPRTTQPTVQTQPAAPSQYKSPYQSPSQTQPQGQSQGQSGSEFKSQSSTPSQTQPAQPTTGQVKPAATTATSAGTVTKTTQPSSGTTARSTSTSIKSGQYDQAVEIKTNAGPTVGAGASGSSGGAGQAKP